MSNGRNAPDLGKRVRQFLWPKKGFVRAWKYLAVRLSRLKSSPHAIAAGFASGAAASVSPLLGLHILLAFAIAFVTRGSMIAAVLGTFVGNPLTFPVFFSATYYLGARLKAVAASEPAAPIDPVALDEQTEAEADAAADAVLDAAGDAFDGVFSFAALDRLWPALSTMLIGALVLVPVAYVLFYVAARAILSGLHRRKRG